MRSRALVLVLSLVAPVACGQAEDLAWIASPTPVLSEFRLDTAACLSSPVSAVRGASATFTRVGTKACGGAGTCQANQMCSTTAGALLESGEVLAIPNQMPAGGAGWCISLLARSLSGADWNAGNHYFASAGTAFGANSILIGSAAASTTIDFYTYDAAGTSRYLRCPQLPLGTAEHDIRFCNAGGVMSLTLDGWASGWCTHNGAGTAIVGTMPASVNIGSYASGFRVRAHRLCRTSVPSKCPPIVGPRGANAVVALGDSITLGNTLTTPWPERLNLALGSPPWDVVNAGLSGSWTSGFVTRWTGGISQQGFGVLLLLGGTNDVGNGVSAATAFANLKSISDSARAAGMHVILGTVPPFKGSALYSAAKEVERKALNTSILAECVASGIPCADIDAALNDGTDTCSATACAGGACCQPDAIHPTQAGADVIEGRYYTAGQTGGYW